MVCSSPAGSPRSRGGALIRSTGIAEHEAKIPDDLVAALRRLADELGVPLSSVLLAAHAKVLAALSGEREVATGYVGRARRPTLPCRLTTEPDSWRTLLLDHPSSRVRSCWRTGLPGGRSQARAGPDGTVVRDRVRPNRARSDGLIHRPKRHRAVGLGIVQQLGDDGQLTLRLRYRTDVLDADSAARIAGYHLTALELIAADLDAEHRRQSLLSAEEAPLPARRARRTAAGAAGPPGARAVRAAGGGASGRVAAVYGDSAA